MPPLHTAGDVGDELLGNGKPSPPGSPTLRGGRKGFAEEGGGGGEEGVETKYVTATRTATYTASDTATASTTEGASTKSASQLVHGERVELLLGKRPPDLSWKDDVMNVLEYFTARTPGSFIEEVALMHPDAVTLTWHYKDADLAFGTAQAKELQLHLEHILAQLPAEVTTAPTGQYMVVRPTSVHKGILVDGIKRGLLEDWGWHSDDFDFVFCCGDERTDESLFKALSPNNLNNAWPGCMTCVVGKKISHASYYVDEPEDVLQTLAAINRGGSAPRGAPSGAVGGEEGEQQQQHQQQQPGSVQSSPQSSMISEGIVFRNS